MCSTPPTIDEIGRAHRDLAGARRRRRQRAGAHAVDREAGHGVRQPGEQGDVASERQALVADLRRRGQDHVADALGGNGRVAAQQLAHDLDRHVVGARLPEGAAGPRLAEGGPDAVDEHHLAQLASHGREDIRRLTGSIDVTVLGRDGAAPAVQPPVCDDCAWRPAGGAGLL